ncbi:MAG: metallophosphoesterase family protein [Proteobacteria bacterium]|nr:metallophosphoesterase family protein [Pseudomonadota bacterium]MBU1583108.1 metallophosphoesterase family protein [Pseudomonadota bacterium]MBU2455693.1 metallophosphoesterase family protein [Pseudomonadota bacterium]MBU2629373.1 metallophosphoesterase family protein [Pseudomonadota bacterium]
MKILRKSRVLLFIGVLWLCAASCPQAGENSITTLPERIVLNVTQTPAGSQAVTWQTLKTAGYPAAQIIKLSELLTPDSSPATFPAQTQVVELDKKQIYHHSVIFNSLFPDTLYAYRVGEAPCWSEWNQFKTASQTREPFTFLYFGDIQKQIFPMCSQMFRAALQQEPESRFWLLCGDMVNNGPDDREWNDFFNAMGWMPRTIPLVLVPGNHEYPDKRFISQDAYHITNLWRPQFAQPENGPKGLEESAFSFEYQGVCFIVLNGNEQTKEQAVWMETILLKNKQPWIIVAIHQPVYSISQRKDRTNFQDLLVPVFDRFSVDLVLQGHDHGYTRTFPLKNNQLASEKTKGTIYVISNAGPKVYPVGSRYDHLMAKTRSGGMLFQSIRVDKNRLQFKAYDMMKKVVDSFDIRKIN